MRSGRSGSKYGRSGRVVGWSEVVQSAGRRVRDVASTYVLCPHLRNRDVFQFKEGGNDEGGVGMSECRNVGRDVGRDVGMDFDV